MTSDLNCFVSHNYDLLPESRGDEAGEAGEAIAEAGALGGDVPAHEAFAGGAVHGAGVEPQAGLVAEFFLEDG